MESVLSIRARIAPLARRVRWSRGIYWGTRCLRYSLLAALPLLLAKSFLPGPPGWWLCALLIIGGGGGLIYGLSRPVPLRDLARLTEERLDLRARLSTALECHDRQDRSFFALALYRDAPGALPAFTGRDVLPLHPPRECRGLVPVGLAVLLLWYAPPLPWDHLGMPQSSTKAGGPPEETARSEFDEGTGQPVSVEPPQIHDRRWRMGSTPSSRIPRRMDALFKDSPLGKVRPDFSSFLSGGDARMKFLGQSQKIPDLRGEDLQSPYQIVVQRMRELSGGGTRDLTPDEAKRMLAEVQRMGKGGGFPGPADSGGREKLTNPGGERVRRALERALERLRREEEARLKRSKVPKGSEPGVRRERRASGGEEPHEGESGLKKMRGSLPGEAQSNLRRGDPTPRPDASPRDTTLKGQPRGGRSQAYTTNILGVGRGGKPKAPSLSVLSRYRQMMEEALSREPIPPDYREQVKTYFDSLRPQGATGGR
ncbi:MAG: hypothetical protein ACE5IQ_11200 [Candidatus Methylomirabilales bacterium]